MKKILSFATVAFFSLMGVSHAAMIDVTLGATGSSALTYGTGGSLNPNVNFSTLSPTTLGLNDAYIVNPATTVSGYFIQPSGPIYGNNYLAVFGSPYFTGSASLAIQPNVNIIGFTWGTVDLYNTLVIQDARGDVYNITGADILNQLTNPVPGTSQSDVSFFDPYANIVKVEITSSQNSFEVANLEETDPPSAVPLPPALPLFAMALMAIGFVSYRKSSKAA